MAAPSLMADAEEGAKQVTRPSSSSGGSKRSLARPGTADRAKDKKEIHVVPVVEPASAALAAAASVSAASPSAAALPNAAVGAAAAAAAPKGSNTKPSARTAPAAVESTAASHSDKAEGAKGRQHLKQNQTGDSGGAIEAGDEQHPPVEVSFSQQPPSRKKKVDWSTVALPEGWERRTDASTGKEYYLDHLNKVTQWRHPSHVSRKHRGGGAASGKRAATTGGDHQHHHDDDGADDAYGEGDGEGDM